MRRRSVVRLAALAGMVLVALVLGGPRWYQGEVGSVAHAQGTADVKDDGMWSTPPSVTMDPGDHTSVIVSEKLINEGPDEPAHISLYWKARYESSKLDIRLSPEYHDFCTVGAVPVPCDEGGASGAPAGPNADTCQDTIDNDSANGCDWDSLSGSCVPPTTPDPTCPNVDDLIVTPSFIYIYKATPVQIDREVKIYCKQPGYSEILVEADHTVVNMTDPDPSDDHSEVTIPVDCLSPTPTPTATPTATPTPPPGLPRMEKDADVSDPDIDTTNSLWLMAAGCVKATEGKGCLEVDKRVFDAYDEDSPNDSDLDPEGVGAWEEQKKFDHKIVSLEPIPDNAWLESTGRTASCTVTVITENWILEGCETQGAANGPQGSGLIERIIVHPQLDDLKLRIRPTKDNGIVTDIIDENCELADIYGVAENCPPGQPCTPDFIGALPGGLLPVCGDVSITVRMLEGDLNLDCQVTVADDQAVAYRYGSFFGLALYDPWFDLEPKYTDFDIDIKDLQFVFGRNYSTCQEPIPDQPPAAPPQGP